MVVSSLHARLSHSESLVAESATPSIFIVCGLLEIDVLILHYRKASLNKLLAH